MLFLGHYSKPLVASGIDKSIDGIEKALVDITGDKGFVIPPRPYTIVPNEERLDNIHKKLDEIVQDIHKQRSEK